MALIYKSWGVQSDVLYASLFLTPDQNVESDVQDALYLSQNIFQEIEPTRLFISSNATDFIARYLFMRKNFFGTALRTQSSIRRQMFKSRTIQSSIRDTNRLFITKPTFNALLANLGTTRIKVEYRITLDGEDVTDRVASCSINYSMDSFVGTLDLTWADYTLYDRVDCSDMLKNYMIERVEVYTRLATNDNPAWVLQGRFFLEKRTASATYQGVQLTSWGRTRGSLLSLPYSKPLTKVWLEDTTAKAIAEELCAATNPPVSLSWEIADYPVLGSNIDVEGTEPISIISTLAATVGGVVACAKDGTIKVIYRYSLASLVEYPTLLPPEPPVINGAIGGNQQAVVYFT